MAFDGTKSKKLIEGALMDSKRIDAEIEICRSILDDLRAEE